MNRRRVGKSPRIALFLGIMVSMVPQPMKRRNRGTLRPSGAVWQEILEGTALSELRECMERGVPGAVYSNPCPNTNFHSWAVDRVPVLGVSVKKSTLRVSVVLQGVVIFSFVRWPVVSTGDLFVCPVWRDCVPSR